MQDPDASVPPRWAAGAPVVRREVIRQGVWHGIVAIVVEDTPSHLVTYIPSGAPHGFPEGDWPTEDGRHAWSDRTTWQGHGVLMVQEPDAWHAVWHFWSGAQRVFDGWYINVQEPFRRTPLGYDTQDLELDIWVPHDGEWRVKDAELVSQRVDEGRFTPSLATRIEKVGERLVQRLRRGDRWWDPNWADWSPPAEWGPHDLPHGWAACPTT